MWAQYIKTLKPTLNVKKKKNQLDSNYITVLVAMISQLKGYINSVFIDFLCHLITPFYNFYHII